MSESTWTFLIEPTALWLVADRVGSVTRPTVGCATVVRTGPTHRSGEIVSTTQVRRWTRQEYERMAEVGLIGPDERVELVDGRIVERAPRYSSHATGIRLAETAARAIFGIGYDVRGQLPLALGDYAEPEPDVAVVRGDARTYTRAHPTSAVLVIEVAESSPQFDRTEKAADYARAGLLDYWITNLIDRQIEILRDPGPLPGRDGTFGYRSRTIARPGETTSPLARPDVSIAVDDLLP